MGQLNYSYTYYEALGMMQVWRQRVGGDGGVKNVSKNADIYNIASAFLGGGGVNNGQKMADVILKSSLIYIHY